MASGAVSLRVLFHMTFPCKAGVWTLRPLASLVNDCPVTAHNLTQ